MSEYEAGRELDALVAEKVMGWKRVRPYLDTIVGEPPEHPGEDNWNVAGYSTDISAAWEVVENGFMWPGHVGKPMLHLLRECANGRWEAQWCSDFGYSETTRADTAPLAICLAALKAVEGN